MRSDCTGPPEGAGEAERTESVRHGTKPKMSERRGGGKRYGRPRGTGYLFTCGEAKQMVIVEPLPEVRIVRTQFRARGV